MTVYYRLENKRRDEAEGGKPPDGFVVDVINQHDLAPGRNTMRCFVGLLFNRPLSFQASDMFPDNAVAGL
jgi:hypothetical protein